MGDFLTGKRAMATERITVSSTAVGGTAATYNDVGTIVSVNRNQVAAGGLKAAGALIECLTEGIYFTLDASTPNGTNGHALAAGDTYMIQGYQPVSELRMVRSGASDAAVQITYFV